MRGTSVLFVCIMSLLMLTPVFHTGSSDTPVMEDGSVVYDRMIYLVGGGNLSVTTQVTTLLPVGTGRTEFSKVLDGDMLVVGENIGSAYGFKLHLKAISDSFQSSATLKIEAFDGGTSVAEGTVTVTATTETYIVDMILKGSAQEHAFSRGNRFRIDIQVTSGSASLRGGTGAQGHHGFLSLEARMISDISHETRNSRGEEAWAIPVNDWPQNMVNITGEISSAFGNSDISSVRIAINKGTAEQFNSTVQRSELEYWHVWNFSNSGSGDYTYLVMVYDIQDNSYTVNGTFQISDNGVLLTYKFNGTEQFGHLETNMTPRATLNFTVNVRNTGAFTTTATLSISGGSNRVELSGESLSPGNKVENITSKGFKSVTASVAGGNIQIGSSIVFTIHASTTESVLSTLHATVEIIPSWGVSLSAPMRDIYVYPGGIANFTVTIKNTSPDTSDEFSLSFDIPIQGDWNATTTNESSYELPSGAEETFNVIVHSPYELVENVETLAIVITARSVLNADIRAYLTLTTYATKGVSIDDPGAQDVNPGSSLVLPVQINNIHSDSSTFFLSLTTPVTWKDTPPGISRENVAILGLNHETVDLTIRPTLSNTPEGTYDFTLKAEKTDNPLVYSTQRIRVTVNGQRLYSIDAPATQRVNVGSGQIMISLEIVNAGNVEDSAFPHCEIFMSSGGSREEMEWKVEYREEGGEIQSSLRISPDMGETVTVHIIIEIPREAKTGNYEMEITLLDVGDRALPLEGYDEEFPMLINLKVEAPAGTMLSIAAQEMLLPMVLLILVFAVSYMSSVKKKKSLEGA